MGRRDPRFISPRQLFSASERASELQDGISPPSPPRSRLACGSATTKSVPYGGWCGRDLACRAFLARRFGVAFLTMSQDYGDWRYSLPWNVHVELFVARRIPILHSS